MDQHLRGTPAVLLHFANVNFKYLKLINYLFEIK